MQSSTRVLVALSTLSLLVGPATAVAGPDASAEAVTKVVRFKDLDLSTGSGAETLYGRIAAAARVVCRGAPQGAVRSCRAQAVDDAVRTIRSPLLSSVHRASSDGVEEVVLR